MDVLLEGIIQDTINRVTPQGKLITEIQLAVNNEIIHCIAYGYNANRLNGMTTGCKIRLGGARKAQKVVINVVEAV